jgi:hypothetical protein
VEIDIMKVETLYFKDISEKHTAAVVKQVRKTISENQDIKFIVVATTEGSTGVTFAREFSERKVIVVTHHSGFKEPNYNELTNENRGEIQQEGATILTATHAFAGVSRGIRNKVDTWTPVEMMALAFRTFCQGTKVCAEIALMAADAGLIPVDEDVICVAGTGRGADTAWLIRPANTNSFADLKMKACLCKPMEF